ncbi:hypothetical protein [Kitasatospora sp. NPDC056181]|uniref:hypothetical protein n=1 Tax=Kitasatospora sp. NPDC056181 TaxID=3345737 RepID=UPI0035D9A435
MEAEPDLDAQLSVVLFRGGWADIDFMATLDDTGALPTPDNDSARTFGDLLDHCVARVWSRPLDQFVEQSLLPDYNRGLRRQPNRAYKAVEYAIARARRRGDQEAVRELGLQRRTLPGQDPNDPDYRRLRYVRYAYDWLLGFPAPSTKPRRSSRGSVRSCVPNSSWNSPRPRL